MGQLSLIGPMGLMGKKLGWPILFFLLPLTLQFFLFRQFRQTPFFRETRFFRFPLQTFLALLPKDIADDGSDDEDT